MKITNALRAALGLGAIAAIALAGPALAAGSQGCASPACVVADEQVFHHWPPIERLRWGYGMTGRDEVAVRAYAAAAQAGDGGAMFNYGLMLLQGRGVSADPAAGRDWIERSLGMGVVAAALVLGDLERLGSAGTADLRRAAAYYRLGAEAGDVRGMHALGNLYIAGAGVPRAAEDAYVWYLLAAGRGFSASVAPRDRLREVLPPALRAAAEARAASGPSAGR